MLNETGGEAGMDQEMIQRLFHWFDYVVFVIMLAVSTAIGVFFGCFGNKQKKTVDYLLGGKTMSVFPVGVSLVASYVSGITILAVPSELYVNGSMVWFSIFGIVLMGVVTNYIFLPVLYQLQMVSSFEYLERRFSRKIRTFASILNMINMVMFVPILIYIPTLSLSSVTGLSIHIINPIVSSICIFYTMMGGLKAVIWTDCIQGFLTFISCVVVMILGFVRLGGFASVWERNVIGERLQNPEFDLSPLNRNTVWAAMFGTLFHSLSLVGVRQGFVVKFLSLPTLTKAKRSLLFMVIGVVITHTITVAMGLLIYAAYADCDPLSAKTIQRADQLLSLYIMDVSSNIPGFPGIFMAGIFGASLSSMSICLNALAGNIYEDLINPYWTRGRLTENRVGLILKAIVVGLGTLCALMVVVVAVLSDLYELAISTASITSGALLGLFALGVLFPGANSKGALAGSVTSMMFVGWLVIGAQLARKNGSISSQPLSSSVESCNFNVTLTPALVHTETAEPAFVLYRLAFYYFPVIGTLLVIMVGLVVSYMTGQQDLALIETSLFAPFLQKYVQRKKDEVVRPYEREMLTMR